MLSWQYALASAIFLAVVTAVLRWLRRGAAWAGVAFEAALLFGLYALWQYAGSFS